MKTFILTIPKILNILVIFSIAALILKIFVLNGLPELFEGAHEVGLMVEAVLASIMASYVFYLFVVHLKETNDKKVIYPLILNWSKIVVGDCSSQLLDISQATNTSLELANVTKELISDALESVSPSDLAPLMLEYPNNYATWIQYLLHNRSRTKEYISKIISQSIYAEIGIISKIVEIDDCSHFKQLKSLNGIPMRNTDISFMANLFYKYCVLCRELKFLIDESELIYMANK